MECKNKLLGTIRGLILLMLPVLWGCLCLTTQAGKLNAKILFISSYSYAWETVSLQVDGILGICLCIFYHNLSGNICPVVYHLPAFR